MKKTISLVLRRLAVSSHFSTLLNSSLMSTSAICGTTLCLKTVCHFVKSQPIFKMFALLKGYELCYQHLHSFPPHLAYIATLPWKVKSLNLLKITKDTTQKSYCNNRM